MKNSLLAALFCISSSAFGQSGFDGLNREIEIIKAELKSLKTELQSVQSENLYLKKVLQINKPVLETEADHSVYRITQVQGNRKAQTITVHLLVETKNENKTSFLQDFSAVDLLGNEYKIDQLASSNTNPKLSLNTPIAVRATFKDIIDEPQILKIVRFASRNEPERRPTDFSKSKLEFRDLAVKWD